MSNWGISCPGGTPVLTGQGCLKYLLGVKKADFIPPGVFILMRSTTDEFAIPFRG